MPNNFSHFNPIGTKLHNDNIVSLHDLRFFNHITALGASGSVIGGKNLKIVDVPESVTYLPRFSLGFEHSVIVIFHSVTPPSYNWSFSSSTYHYDRCTPTGCKFYVPDESVDEYIAAFTSGRYALTSGSIIHPMSEYQP